MGKAMITMPCHALSRLDGWHLGTIQSCMHVHRLFSAINSFMSRPAPGTPVNMIAFGDLGQTMSDGSLQASVCHCLLLEGRPVPSSSGAPPCSSGLFIGHGAKPRHHGWHQGRAGRQDAAVPQRWALARPDGWESNGLRYHHACLQVTSPTPAAMAPTGRSSTIRLSLSPPAYPT